MALTRHASKSSIKNMNESSNKTPMKTKGSKKQMISDLPMAKVENENQKAINLEDIHTLTYLTLNKHGKLTFFNI